MEHRVAICVPVPNEDITERFFRLGSGFSEVMNMTRNIRGVVADAMWERQCQSIVTPFTACDS
jgi:hypothetical protein